jgi:hypothetical protein
VQIGYVFVSKEVVHRKPSTSLQDQFKRADLCESAAWRRLG